MIRLVDRKHKCHFIGILPSNITPVLLQPQILLIWISIHVGCYKKNGILFPNELPSSFIYAQFLFFDIPCVVYCAWSFDEFPISKLFKRTVWAALWEILLLRSRFPAISIRKTDKISFGYLFDNSITIIFYVVVLVCCFWRCKRW